MPGLAKPHLVGKQRAAGLREELRAGPLVGVGGQSEWREQVGEILLREDRPPVESLLQPAHRFRLHPLVESAQRSGNEPGIRRRLLVLQSAPLQHRVVGVFALRSGGIEPHQSQCAGAVVQEVRMHAHPSVIAAIESRELVPDVG